MPHLLLGRFYITTSKDTENTKIIFAFFVFLDVIIF